MTRGGCPTASTCAWVTSGDDAGWVVCQVCEIERVKPAGDPVVIIGGPGRRNRLDSPERDAALGLMLAMCAGVNPQDAIDEPETPLSRTLGRNEHGDATEEPT